MVFEGVNMIRKSNIIKTYTQRGLKRYHIEIWHDGLGKYQLIRSDDKYVLTQKANEKIRQWNEIWEKRQAAERKRLEREQKARDIEQKKALAEEKTIKAQELLDSMNEILGHTLYIDDTINWESLKNNEKFAIPEPKKPKTPPEPIKAYISPEPNKSDEKYTPKFGFLDGFSKKRKEKVKKEAHELYLKDKKAWELEKKEINDQYVIAKNEYISTLSKLEKEYLSKLKAWEEEKVQFLKKQEEENEIIDLKKEKYLNCDLEAVLDYCDMVLSNSEYYYDFPQEYELDYNPETKIIVVNYQIPSLEAIPTLKEVKYIQSRDEFIEKQLTKSQINKLYDSVLYQITLRTIHELFEADRANALEAIVFNGYVNSIDPATGQKLNSCVLSIQSKKDEFLEINLEMVEPKACFRKLKGVSSSKLHSLTPIPPLAKIERDDKRFVDSYDVVEGIEEGYNLAAMDWEDFEHLIREIFEKAFAEAGGEVKVTRASRDGGIDAVIFDPDPLRGGKIVVQAKRYTNVVGVSAVRDLYGSLMNEGANKGILVTTSYYGSDAYEFSKGKPIQLIDGNNLLYLLEQHGHKARIDLKEAKRILNENG
jgi:restriction system protein